MAMEELKREDVTGSLQDWKRWVASCKTARLMPRQRPPEYVHTSTSNVCPKLSGLQATLQVYSLTNTEEERRGPVSQSIFQTRDKN